METVFNYYDELFNKEVTSPEEFKEKFTDPSEAVKTLPEFQKFCEVYESFVEEMKADVDKEESNLFENTREESK